MSTARGPSLPSSFCVRRSLSPGGAAFHAALEGASVEHGCRGLFGGRSTTHRRIMRRS